MQSLTGYVKRSWHLVVGERGWLRILRIAGVTTACAITVTIVDLLLARLLLPMENGLVFWGLLSMLPALLLAVVSMWVSGYALEHARPVAFGVDATIFRVDIGSCLKNSWRVLLAMLPHVLIVAIVTVPLILMWAFALRFFQQTPLMLLLAPIGVITAIALGLSLNAWLKMLALRTVIYRSAKGGLMLRTAFRTVRNHLREFIVVGIVLFLLRATASLILGFVIAPISNGLAANVMRNAFPPRLGSSTSGPLQGWTATLLVDGIIRTLLAAIWIFPLLMFVSMTLNVLTNFMGYTLIALWMRDLDVANWDGVGEVPQPRVDMPATETDPLRGTGGTTALMTPAGAPGPRPPMPQMSPNATDQPPAYASVRGTTGLAMPHGEEWQDAALMQRPDVGLTTSNGAAVAWDIAQELVSGHMSRDMLLRSNADAYAGISIPGVNVSLTLPQATRPVSAAVPLSESAPPLSSSTTQRSAGREDAGRQAASRPAVSATRSRDGSSPAGRPFRMRAKSTPRLATADALTIGELLAGDVSSSEAGTDVPDAASPDGGQTAGEVSWEYDDGIGWYHDPATNWYYDQVTGWYYDASTGWYYSEAEGWYRDDSGAASK